MAKMRINLDFLWICCELFCFVDKNTRFVETLPLHLAPGLPELKRREWSAACLYLRSRKHF